MDEERDRQQKARYGEVVYVRVSAEEKVRLADAAARARLSASRYLARTALDGRPPPTAAERQELERLLRLFFKARRGLSRLLGNARQMKLAGADLEMEETLQEVQQALAALTQALEKRL